MRTTTLARFAASAAVLMTVVPTAFAFTDVSTNHRFFGSITWLQQQGAVQGYADGTYRSDALVNRAEFLKVLLTLTRPNAPAADVRCFSDFKGNEQWFWKTACSAKTLNILRGYPDGSFRGTQLVTHAEAVKMAVVALGLTLPVYVREPDHWYDPYYDAAASMSVFDWAGDAEPTHNLNRGEMAQLLYGFSAALAEQNNTSDSRLQCAFTDDGQTQVRCIVCEDGNECDR